MSGSKNCNTFIHWNTMQQKKEGITTFVTAWMEPDNIMLSDTSQLVKDKDHMMSVIKGI